MSARPFSISSSSSFEVLSSSSVSPVITASTTTLPSDIVTFCHLTFGYLLPKQLRKNIVNFLSSSWTRSKSPSKATRTWRNSEYCTRGRSK
ncbi:hypothetical protein X975_13585, partial [Stegodyphus mimosarum]